MRLARANRAADRKANRGTRKPKLKLTVNKPGPCKEWHRNDEQRKTDAMHSTNRRCHEANSIPSKPVSRDFCHFLALLKHYYTLLVIDFNPVVLPRK